MRRRKAVRFHTFQILVFGLVASCGAGGSSGSEVQSQKEPGPSSDSDDSVDDSTDDSVDDRADPCTLSNGLGIEENLKAGVQLASLYLPIALGGELENVIDLVDELITQSAGAGLELHNAPFWRDLAMGEFAEGNYRTSYARLIKAYRLLTQES